MKEKSNRKKVLVVGQTPPPFHGQAIMIQYLLDGQYDRIDMKHLNMSFSKEMGSVGKFRFGKILLLFPFICRILFYRLRGYRNLYYPPASGNLVPILRDVLLLGSTRFFFSKTILHFHSGDLTDAYERLPGWLRSLYRAVYCDADLAIVVAKECGIDLNLLRPKHSAIIPNAVQDHGVTSRSDRHNEVPIVLYVGAVSREKGLIELVEATHLLLQKQIDCRVEIVGEFRDEAFEREFRHRVSQLKLQSHIHFHGRVSSTDQKYQIYSHADIFCFPTFYAAETFGIVLIEAMSSGLPVVSTRWRSIPDTVEHGATGLLVEPRDAKSLAGAIEQLVNDRDSRLTMGAAGRQHFEDLYTLKAFHRLMDERLAEVCV